MDANPNQGLDRSEPDEVRVSLRLPADLHERLNLLAGREERSLNGQIVFLLRQALHGRRRTRIAVLADHPKEFVDILNSEPDFYAYEDTAPEEVQPPDAIVCVLNHLETVPGSSRSKRLYAVIRSCPSVVVVPTGATRRRLENIQVELRADMAVLWPAKPATLTAALRRALHGS